MYRITSNKSKHMETTVCNVKENGDVKDTELSVCSLRDWHSLLMCTIL